MTAILSDLEEEAAEIAATRGRRPAERFVRWQVAHSALPWLLRRARELASETKRGVAMTYRGLWSDVRVAARRLAHSRGFTALATVTLAIGIGAVSTAFSLAHALWLKPLPYLEPDRLVWIQARHRPSGTAASLTAAELAEYRREIRALVGVAGFRYGAHIARLGDEPVRVVAHRVSPNLFRVLGVQPRLGRDFTDAEATADARVVMLSDAAWTKRFARDPAILGRALTLDGVGYQVVGVLPRGFTFPRGLEAEVWIPADLTAGGESIGRGLQAVARLAPGSSLSEAGLEVAALADRMALAMPETTKDWTMVVSPAGATASPASQAGFQALLSIVALFLVIACANLAGLLLARNAARRAEFAVCLSIGASRWRLARMLFVESLLLSGLGCLAGVLLASYGARMLATVMPARTPGLDDVGLNATVTRHCGGGGARCRRRWLASCQRWAFGR